MTTDTLGATPHVGQQDSTPVQLLTPSGDRVQSPPYAELTSHLDRAWLESRYRDMALVRRFDAEATALQRQGELGLWAPCEGQEAAQVGTASALSPQDFIFPSYRDHGVAQVRGMDLNRLLHLYRGQVHGGWGPQEHNMATPSLVIGSHGLHAAGYGLGILRDGDVATGDPTRDRAVVAYFGDGATSQGDIHEAMVFAAAAQAPVIFVCQNNQWAISVPTATQSRIPLYHRGEGIGIPSVRVDGNDVIASHAVMAEAVTRAHSGGGPTFIEAVTYRMGAHTTSDDPTRYRAGAEEDHWRGLDPITRLRTLLAREGTPETFFAEVDAEADAAAEHTRSYCRSLRPPDPGSMFEHVYATPQRLVQAERDWYEEYESGFEGGGL